MLSLRNDALDVQVLDPIADRDRFGVRYCTGGYVFQVRDHELGDLLSGPTYPASFNWFDGQGLPDAFNLNPLRSTKTLGEAAIIGIGVCDLDARRVISFCDWHVTRATERIQFSTTQAYEDYAFTLDRTVSLFGRTVRSQTQLANTGQSFVPVRWFPHPFYPQTTDGELLWLNTRLRWRDGAGYRRLPNGFIARDGQWNEGHYLPLDHESTAPLVVLQRHPLLGLVSAQLSYVPAFFPIWGNAFTMSWEPFLERMVAPGTTLDWTIDYTF